MLILNFCADMGEGNEMNDFVEASRSIKKQTALVFRQAYHLNYNSQYKMQNISHPVLTPVSIAFHLLFIKTLCYIQLVYIPSCKSNLCVLPEQPKKG